MDPELMTDEQLAERDRVLITCTGCGQTYGYSIATIAQQRGDIEALEEQNERMREALKKDIDFASLHGVYETDLFPTQEGE
jgi:hypothetical protein